MSTPPSKTPAEGDPSGLGSRVRLSTIQRFVLGRRDGGFVASLLTVGLAFALGGVLIVVTTGQSPFGVYAGIFKGAGLDWLFPWVQGAEREAAAFNLQQTLLLTTTLILTGLAVAFAFRCGLFNIGGQGQYMAGAIVAVIVGTHLTSLSPFLHVTLALALGTLAGAGIAALAGALRAAVGAHEVITTIMLNWIVVWAGVFLFTVSGPFQDTEGGAPISKSVADGAKLPVIWGDPGFQGLHLGVFVALGALVAYAVLLNRTTLGFEVRAVGFSPEAARYAGIRVNRSYVVAMAVSGVFAGLAGAIDILGWQFRLSTGDVQASAVGFVGIAVALLGRNTAVGVALAAFLFSSLLTGTSTRNLDPEVFEPGLASNLTLLIQGLIVLFVGADVIVLWLLAKLRRNAA